MYIGTQWFYSIIGTSVFVISSVSSLKNNTKISIVRKIDRKKNIFKLVYGEYIALEKIENIYAKHPIVAQFYLRGDSLHHSLVGIVVPDPEELADLSPFSIDNGLLTPTLKVKRPQARKHCEVQIAELYEELGAANGSTAATARL
ncbi:hypothetical protein BDB00DRAFT_792652 [Zychaea mexicana]|uniref:uncharacterized protein n=1 Tax=Zychaea mexicana TaxID=64656 RepID=UPI0022FDD38E|nr:uncharacterized protein BDB00DRAFT_792652 [Zychaea mexicana]KAI9484745.1 hypothetical protein BDB00DRAFT_792652 [Zychaea mexicana]